MIVESNANRRSAAPSYGALLPRARRRPSPRNMQIYEAARVRHERQADVAANNGLTQQRVSEICAQVEQWYEWQASAPDYEAIEANERRLRLLEARQREETILLLALRQAIADRQTLVTEKSVITAEGTNVTRTEKCLPLNPAWLKIAESASEAIFRINTELGPDVQTSALADEINRLWGELLGGSRDGEGESGRGEERETEANPEEVAKSCTSCNDKLKISVVKREADTALKSATDGQSMPYGETGRDESGD